MPLVAGRTVREGLPSNQRRVNLHRVGGASLASRIALGLELRIDSLSRSAASADVQVSLTNTGGGHAVPAGMATRTLVLAVGVDTGSREMQHRRERIYGRELKDEHGHTLASVQDLFLKAAIVGADTRLKPKETRSERFTVPLPEGSKAIVVRLEYRDASDPKTSPTTTLVTEQRRDLAAP